MSFRSSEAAANWFKQQMDPLASLDSGWQDTMGKNANDFAPVAGRIRSQERLAVALRRETRSPVVRTVKADDSTAKNHWFNQMIDPLAGSDDLWKDVMGKNVTDFSAAAGRIRSMDKLGGVHKQSRETEAPTVQVSRSPDGITITDIKKGSSVKLTAEGTKITTKSDGALITESKDGGKMSVEKDGTVILEKMGVRTLQKLDGTIIIEKQDGSRITITKDGRVWRSLAG